MQIGDKLFNNKNHELTIQNIEKGKITVSEKIVINITFDNGNKERKCPELRGN